MFTNFKIYISDLFGAIVEVFQKKEFEMKGILLWFVGLPIPIIILLYLFGVL